MRFALLGAGRIGRMHARILAATPGVDELVVADAAPDLGREIAGEVGATPAESVDDAIATADAVVIAAATTAHAGLVRSALARRIPIFCEKPLAESLAETIDLAAAIETSDVPFQLGFQRRFDPGYREARRLLETGELGTLYAARLAGHDPAPPHESYIPASGGLFRDFSIHDFDVIRWLTGVEVAEVYAMGAVRGFEVFAKYDDVDTAVGCLRMDDGALVALTVARHDPRGYDIRAELFGSKDSISVGMGPRMPMRSVEPGVAAPSEPGWANFIERFAVAYRAEIVEFVAVAHGSRPSPCTARDGLQALRVAEAATRSMHDGRPIRLEEIPA
jgi:myo-inositol 2-dehydrogenase / D-chiro-inositol 1-dehydrogenase